MVGMVLDARQPFDDGGHAASGPELGAKVVGFRTLLKGAFQLAEILVSETRPAPRAASPFERPGAVVLPGAVPPADRLPVDPELAGDLSLAHALVEEFGGLDPPPFQFCKLFRIAFDAFRITHAQSLPPGHRCVTILCRNQ